jgi:hypothetical protein
MVGKAHNASYDERDQRYNLHRPPTQKTPDPPSRNRKQEKNCRSEAKDLRRTSARGELGQSMVAAFASVSLYRGRLGFCRGGALQPAGSPEAVNLSRPIDLDKPSGLY